MYNHENQYRCTIIRGKSQREIDDFLPAYAKIISDICPCPKDEFDAKFNELFANYIPKDSTKKTFDNHRTEIAGQLFGMYYTIPQGTDDSELYVYPAERTLKFLEDNDQPAFFKDVCYKMQFPNGMTIISTTQERIALGISIRPNCYVLKILTLAKYSGLTINKNDIGYYVLNSLDVLQRKANPLEVIEQIEKDKKENIERKVHTPGKASSYNMQHINEQINYLELANLVITSEDGEVRINENERAIIDIFAEHWNDNPPFDVSSCDLSTVKSRKEFQFKWDEYYSKLSDSAGQFATTVASLGIPEEVSTPAKHNEISTIEIGDEGEAFVYKYEKKRVGTFDTRLANKVLHLGKTKGLGYDIQSVIAEQGDMSEFVKYIEVKSTKRVTEPDINDDLWIDTLNITRNEWVAAQQHKDFYSIFRVYFVRGNIIMYVIENLCQKERENTVKVTPMTYRIDFGNSAVDRVIQDANV